MIEGIKFTESAEELIDVRVMGIDTDDDLFEGVIVEAITWDKSHNGEDDHALLRIIGTTHNGTENKTFNRILPIKGIKIYNKDQYNLGIELLQKYRIQLESAEYFKKKCMEFMR